MIQDKQHRFYNIVSGWAVFLIAAVTYIFTIEPTTSLWDCGEFIASAYKLEVGHPPGAPLFMIMARVASIFASDVTTVAKMINTLSALASAFTILFLFWSITHLAKKIVIKSNEITIDQSIAVLASGAIGALAYTFTDSFWFSAVEAEVYSSSSLFTAVAFWAILKWENVAHEKYANRWLILIAYLMGLSIGIHLLNLLAIPAVVFVYYFKMYPVNRIGIIKTSLVSVAILGVTIYGIIPGIVSVAAKFELLFVNFLSMPFNTGIIIYGIIILSAIVGGIYYTHKNKKVLLNTIMLSITVILIGYSSYTMIVIRSLAEPPMNENSPDNVFSLLSYLNREQYGDRPLVYGQYFNAQVVDREVKYTHIRGEKNYTKIKTTNPNYKYDNKYQTIFPRLYSHQANHISGYKSWTGISGGEKKPSFGDNLEFFFKYQLGHMYLRYFMWNFAGRQNDKQGHGGFVNGNWISGLKFLDSIRLGSQYDLPKSIENDKSRNKYYFLPLILGIIGLIFMFQKSKLDFWVVMLLFFFTGIAIVMYLNQTPYQPRERDYAYVGSFYAFAIWIGIGVLGIYEGLKKLTSPIISASLATIISLSVPTILVSENLADHDRSGRYTARDFAYNYLNSCAPNAILFTYGDNDTFPLWYAQEVEGIRTDVRVVNLSLLTAHWYIYQMTRKAYESEGVPFSMKKHQYMQGKRDWVPIYNRIEKPVALKDVIDFVSSDDPKTKLKQRDGEAIDYIPAQNLVIPVDSAKVINKNIVSPAMAHKLLKAIAWKLNKEYVTKNEMMILDLLAYNNWERPIYFASSMGTDSYLQLQDYFRLDGFAYRFVPIKTDSESGDIGYINTDILYENLMNKFKWGGMDKPDVFMDSHNLRTISIMRIRDVFSRLANTLIAENKKDKAKKVLDKCVSITPHEKIAYDYFMVPIIEMYYKLGETETANKLSRQLVDIYSDNLKYYLNLDRKFAGGVNYEVKLGMSVMQELLSMTAENKQDDLAKEIEGTFTILYQKYVEFIK